MTAAPLGFYSPLAQGVSDSECEAEVGRMMTNGMTARSGVDPQLDAHSDTVCILPNDKPRRMSPLRRFFFVLSVLLCIFTVISFLWLLPCTELGQCSVTGSTQTVRAAWEMPYHDIELKGPVSLVDGALPHEKNLLLLYRGDAINPQHLEGVRSSDDNGIILIVGNSGKVGWFIRQPRLPTDMDCNLIDVDKDGRKDCIIVGNDGLFAAFNPLTGAVHWYLHSHEENDKLFTSVDFPVVIMDVDGDGVDDLLSSCTPLDGKYQNALILISGYRGSIIGMPFVMSECMTINKLQMGKDRIVNFTCKNNTSSSESMQVLKLEYLVKSITNRQYLAKWNDWPVTDQHRISSKSIDEQRNTYTVDGRRLVVENTGRCPKNCKVNVRLIDKRSGKDNISWEYSASRVYGMVPATLSFSKDSSKNRISGFVLKFWQWNIRIKNSNRFDRNVDSNTFNIFNKTPPQTTDSPARIRRNIVKNRYSKSANVTMNHLTERVVLVTFNATDIHIVNASQSDIIQMCVGDRICQPDMANQENSLSIVDLDGDGSRELITYLVSFACADNALAEELYDDTIKCSTEWRLRSTVRIVRLEAELPKLYEAVSHH